LTDLAGGEAAANTQAHCLDLLTSEFIQDGCMAQNANDRSMNNDERNMRPMSRSDD
jgi:hypothetical protein